jgi:hypothetical protein
MIKLAGNIKEMFRKLPGSENLGKKNRASCQKNPAWWDKLCLTQINNRAPLTYCVPTKYFTRNIAF